MSNYDKLMQAGGSAFPTEWQAPDGRIARCAGMTLRDYFASQALPACWRRALKQEAEQEPEKISAIAIRSAYWAYSLADAMLAERAE